MATAVAAGVLLQTSDGLCSASGVAQEPNFCSLGRSPGYKVHLTNLGPMPDGHVWTDGEAVGWLNAFHALPKPTVQPTVMFKPSTNGSRQFILTFSTPDDCNKAKKMLDRQALWSNAKAPYVSECVYCTTTGTRYQPSGRSK